MRLITYISLACFLGFIALGVVHAVFYGEQQNDTILMVAKPLMVLGAITGMILWLGGFFEIATKWNERGAAKSACYLFLLFTFNILFAYFLFLRFAPPIGYGKKVVAE